MLISATMAQFVPKFGNEEQNANFRIGLFTFWAIYGIVPTIHWVFLHEDTIYNPLVSVMLPRILVMYMISGCAFFFYITKFPERVIPGLVDIVGSSHQWWHIGTRLYIRFFFHVKIFQFFFYFQECFLPYIFGTILVSPLLFSD